MWNCCQANGIRWLKSHVVPPFNYLDLKSVMVPFLIPTSGPMLHLISIFWLNKCSGATGDGIGIAQHSKLRKYYSHQSGKQIGKSAHLRWCLLANCRKNHKIFHMPSTTTKSSSSTSRTKIRSRWHYYVLWCQGTAYFSAYPTSNRHHYQAPRKRSITKNRTFMNIRQITSLLEFCLRSTYFTFQNKYYEQIEGTAMGSPISPIVANLYMEDLETKAIQTAPHSPAFWKRFVDDTFVIIKSSHKQEFLDHINSIDHNIQFTSEESREDGFMPFLDMLIIPQEDGRFNTIIYRKCTHTDMYLQWDSQHPISSKRSVVGTLHHWARTVCSNANLLQPRRRTPPKILTTCKYPNWALNRIKMKIRSTPKKKNKSQNKNTMFENYQQPYLVVPYYQGLSASVKRTCNKCGVQVYFKGGVTIKSLLMAPKDQDPMLKRSGVIYKYSCDRVECDEEYIGESSRNFGERFKEHQKAPSPIFDHYTTTGHNIKLENFSIVGKEDQNLKRAIKEAMYIRANDPSLNRNVGKYHLPHIWDEVLFNIPELKIT